MSAVLRFSMASRRCLALTLARVPLLRLEPW
jgi:hypothetical protein